MRAWPSVLCKCEWWCHSGVASLIQFTMVCCPFGLCGAWWQMNSWSSPCLSVLVALMYASRCNATHMLGSLTSFGMNNLGNALPGLDVFICSVMTISNPSLTACMLLYLIILNVCTRCVVQMLNRVMVLRISDFRSSVSRVLKLLRCVRTWFTSQVVEYFEVVGLILYAPFTSLDTMMSSPIFMSPKIKDRADRAKLIVPCATLFLTRYDKKDSTTGLVGLLASALWVKQYACHFLSSERYCLTVDGAIDAMTTSRASTGTTLPSTSPI